MALAKFRLLFSCVFYNFDPGKCSNLEKPDGGSLQLDDKGAKGEKVTLTCEKNYVPSQNFSSWVCYSRAVLLTRPSLGSLSTLEWSPICESFRFKSVYLVLALRYSWQNTKRVKINDPRSDVTVKCDPTCFQTIVVRANHDEFRRYQFSPLKSLRQSNNGFLADVIDACCFINCIIDTWWKPVLRTQEDLYLQGALSWQSVVCHIYLSSAPGKPLSRCSFT